jgi:squalene-associated FAD-dependent desaturase
VVGGGLAGITAALRCADAGLDVVLVESRPRLGGLATSFTRAYEGGELDVDNGQHVFLRCCTSYRALLARLGATGDVTLQERLDIPVRAPGRPAARLRRTALPAPLHLGAALLRYRHLPLADRLRLVPAALALRGVDPADAATDAHSFGDWLAAHGQSALAVERLWDLVGVATLNARAERASLALAATVFQLGLLTDATAGDIGWARVPLGRLHGETAAAALRAAGVDVRTSTRVRELAPVGGGWRISAAGGAAGSGGERSTDRRSEGEEDALMVDRIVSAVPPTAAERLLPPAAFGSSRDAAAPRTPGWAAELGSTPIVNVHVVYDRRVLDAPFVAAVDSPLQWVFDRTEQSGLHRAFPAGAQYVAVSLSAADDPAVGLARLPVARLRERMLPALAALLPAARDAEVLDFFVTREPHATFRAAPGSAALRPGAMTELPGLFLAGAWTATGWPATMEGAVRSGETAADALLATAGARVGAAA